MADPSHDAMTETELQSAVVELAQWLGYLVSHTRVARQADGSWVTPIQGDAGFPDLVLAHKRSGSVLFRELKSQKGRATKGQLMWLAATGGMIWRPSHWFDGEVERDLKDSAVHGKEEKDGDS